LTRKVKGHVIYIGHTTYMYYTRKVLDVKKGFTAQKWALLK
jgi:hypothetical protein